MGRPGETIETLMVGMLSDVGSSAHDDASELLRSASDESASDQKSIDAYMPQKTEEELENDRHLDKLIFGAMAVGGTIGSAGLAYGIYRRVYNKKQSDK